MERLPVIQIVEIGAEPHGVVNR
ncbi:uncharacterized protein METZ01_LOCUS188382 [marine metagenome]|uniref:Uncharacterized protein n=1 Tax=marine metagenome TaxID=408172 RepID=A0A382DAT7_9ZZZZ